MTMKNLVLASTSTVHGSGFLEYLLKTLENHFKNTNEILFIPYARPNGISYTEYTKKASEAFSKIGKKLIGLHQFNDKKQAVEQAKGIFVGGGNTFVLVHQLYSENIVDVLKKTLESGTPYLGTSAGTNICGNSIGTTNDMPIVYPTTFNVLNVVPFNINPHYLDPDPMSKHMGETRETRINEYHQFNSTPVIGLREGSFLYVKGDDISLHGNYSARIFEQNKMPYEIETGLKINFK